MSHIGDTKEEFCPVCGMDTHWEYVIIQLSDGVFGLRNVMDPGCNSITFWRCCGHMTPDGRIKAEVQRLHRHVHAMMKV
ncbi:MAG TPA: hypothetical protein VMT34_01820 [Aggregatilineales bacterium]|nr:hypothetical protein [Aggregatilineales bacterium]